MKLKHITLCAAKDAPDFVVEDIQKFSIQLLENIHPLMENIPPHIALSALNFVHAAMIKKFVKDDEEEIKNAVVMEAKALIMNVESIMKNINNDEFNF